MYGPNAPFLTSFLFLLFNKTYNNNENVFKTNPLISFN